MGIFGSLDANSIPDNPFWVEQGEYRAQVTNAFFQDSKKEGQKQLVICYTIVDKQSKYFNREVRDWFDFYPDIDEETYKSMNGAEQAQVDRTLGAIKRRLCGIARKEDSRGLGVTPEELNEDWEPKVLVDTEVNIGVVNSGDDNEFTNVKWAEMI